MPENSRNITLIWQELKDRKVFRAITVYVAAVFGLMELTAIGFPIVAIISWIYLEKMVDMDSALIWSNKLISKGPENPWGCFNLGSAYAGMDELEKAFEMDSTFHFRYAEFLTVQEKIKEALDHLELALENGYRDLSWIKLNPDLIGLQGEARFEELVDRYFN